MSTSNGRENRETATGARGEKAGTGETARKGLAGLTFLLRLNVGSPIAGIGYELTAIAAVIIGGTSFTGGKGSVIGTFFGVCLLQVLSTGLQLMGVEDNFKTIIIGLVVVLAAVFDTYRSKIIAAMRTS